jgi:hypothetical protein
MIAQIANDCQVVTDENSCETEFLFGFTEQIEDLCLHGNVQRRSRLIGENKGWFQDNCPSDGHPLALAAAQLVGIASNEFSREPHLFQSLHHFRFAFLPVAKSMHFQRGRQDRANLLPGVEGRCGILKNCLHFAAQLQEFCPCNFPNIPVSIQNLSGGWLYEP